MTAIALTIAGSDSCGGAGIQADLKAFSALGVYGASVITAITAQNTQGVTAMHEVPAEIVRAQIDTVLSDIEVGAIKIGMLFSPAIIVQVAEALSKRDIPVVLDPVMIAKSGDALLQDEAVSALITDLGPEADLLTPNLPEAARMLDEDAATTPDEAERQGRALIGRGARAVLMKGGHGTGETCVDLLVTQHGCVELTAPRRQTRNTHGTGCTLSSAIAAGLAKGEGLEQSVRSAHAYLQRAISAADDLKIGHGHGPVHHFTGIWV
ncbi:MAG: bifunctional hydroxymethylpyrimidine kinase/phosphomethylpyrimidine kinase [Pseudomonadota bacterium]